MDRNKAVFLGLLLALSTGILSWFAIDVRAAPNAPSCSNVALSAPAAGSVLSGPVEVRGRALLSNFQFYKVEYAPAGRDQWTLIGPDVIRIPVSEGRLVVWQTTLVRDGSYRLRLHVVDVTGNYCEVLAGPFQVLNVQPTATELPEPTETEAIVAVPVLPTPTIYITVPVEVAPKPGAASTPLPRQTVEVPGINLTVLAAFFLFGVAAMFAIVIFVGAVMLVRRRA